MTSVCSRSFAAALALALLLGGCAAPSGQSRSLPETRNAAVQTAEETEFRRVPSALDFSGLSFTPWDARGAAATLPTRNQAAYTVMIYMNGSDLESEHGAATDDLLEMLLALPGSYEINVVLMTGGANRWRNNTVPSGSCALWRIEGGQLIALGQPGQLNMGDAGTLCGFLDFGMAAFPAERYGLILWDHGGGSIAGYGHDENFQDSCLTLLEMNYAFDRSLLAETKLEFLGFDACLMATAEMAVVASDYARYMVASEDLEPGDGWNYSFLSALATQPRQDGAAVGRLIVDSYMDFYRNTEPGGLTLSVIDLSKAGQVMEAMGTLMQACSGGLSQPTMPLALPIAMARADTKTFGGGTPRDSECDMVDVGDMADRLAELCPAEALALRAALDEAVSYQRHNSATDLSGLSCYYVFGGVEQATAALDIYRTLRMSPAYTTYLQLFSETLSAAVPAVQQQPVSRATDGTIGRNAGPYQPTVAGRQAEMYEAGTSLAGQEYAIPILLNGKQADLIVLVNAQHPDGRVLGARQEEGYVIQKGVDPIAVGDVIALCHHEGTAWPVSAQFTVTAPLTVEWWAQGG